ILTSEGLSRALVRKVGTGMIQPYKNPLAACPTITHLAFADDILIFANGSRKSLQNIKATLQEYEQASGQKINFVIPRNFHQKIFRYVKEIFISEYRCY
ncbi:hypothetical protein, partial [Escherichia coli]|uniref:hypothetical protein n=1 Tax=Escherichia coli TaxID=562 RepID=UPI0032DBE418